MKYPRRLLLVVVASAFLIIGCNRKPAEPSESESLASALLTHTFKGSNEFSYAVNATGAQKPRLVELHNLQSSMLSLPVTETDQMNGITQRFKVVVDCTQSRSFDGQWTPWVDGSAHSALPMLNSVFPSAAAGYWVIQFEKKNGQWSTKNTFPVHNLLQNDALLTELMQAAGAP
jgi:hypothetical protein